MIMSLWLDLREFGGDFDTTAPTHDSRLGLQMASSAQDYSGHTGRFWLHFSIVERSGEASSIFFLQSMLST